MTPTPQQRENAALNREALDNRLDSGAARITQIEKEIRELRQTLMDHSERTTESMGLLSEQIQEISKITLSIKDIVDTGKALFKLGGWIGAFLKWASGLIAAGAVVWLFLWEKRP